jgi:hypothetical protein
LKLHAFLAIAIQDESGYKKSSTEETAMTHAQKMDTFTFLQDVWAHEMVMEWNPAEDTAFNRYLNIICPPEDVMRDQFLADFSDFCG